jgi:hypothetical protein
MASGFAKVCMATCAFTMLQFEQLGGYAAR